MRPHPPDILIATTRSDMSLEYFLTDNVSVAYFEDDMGTFTKKVVAREFDVIYVRDPFNTARLTIEAIAPKIELIKTRHPRAYYIDQVDDIEGVLIEDKWRQYQRWGEWMPDTYLGGEPADIAGPAIAKKRISARSRDILFDVQPSDLSAEWILQERLTIVEELRVYVLFGNPVTYAAKRRSKGLNQTTKVTGVHVLTEDEMTFARELAGRMKEYDFLGLDIATTPEGPRLIEVNRSPQFKRYNKLSGSNLVENFWPDALNRLAQKDR
jgi:glutathione synthase/RimK-type ligase-like ATP-grasp enzyme